MNNFIDAETFLSLDEKVQKVFIDWWKPKFGDLYCTRSVYDIIDVVVNVFGDDVVGLENVFKEKVNKINFDLIPLFQMNQLIDFIEERYKYIEISNFTKNEYSIEVFKKIDRTEASIYMKDKSILQALFKIACEIAEKEVNEN